jgi:hypothetical protein
MAWWGVLQARVVQIRHRAGVPAAWRQPSRAPRQRLPAAVDHYSQRCERLRRLAAKFAPEELPLLTGMSQPLIDQYLALLDQHRLVTCARKKVRQRATS